MEKTAQTPGLVNAIRAFGLTLAIVVAREEAATKLQLAAVKAQIADFENKPKDWRNAQGSTLAQVHEQIDWLTGRCGLAQKLVDGVKGELEAFIAAQDIGDEETLRVLAPAFVEAAWPRRLELYAQSAREVFIRALQRLQGAAQ